MLEITVGRDSDLSAEVVYELLADFGNTSWMNGVAKTEVEGDGVGMVRNIFTAPDAAPVREMLTERDDLKRKIAYTIPENNPMPVDNYSSYVVVTEVGKENEEAELRRRGDFLAPLNKNAISFRRLHDVALPPFSVINK